ncbi:general stress protein [Ureibacillus aquaedulcis]|uniref:General stress protein n=1 Tax=Ureibacillus aquaedulcis TaxID=3058421 RepID=A0ABT8GSQ2_9BACL|nr:general stress protein [Ureibacillus sp. BA0131]MDN4494425.1 general stress protein [Ureibacillus sp. BA0131]
MYSSNFNDPGNHIEVAHTRNEAMEIIERLKTSGTPMGQIHLVGKDLDAFAELKWDADVDLHRTGNAVDKFKSLFTGDDAVMEGLKGIDIPGSQLEYYKQIVEDGGVLIYLNDDMDDDYIDTTPVDRELNVDYTYLDRRHYF